MAKKSTVRKSATGRTTSKQTKRIPQQARRIVEGRVDIRSQMHSLVRDALASGEFGAAEIKRAMSDVFEGVSAGLSKAVPADQNNVLRQTYDGMSDAARGMSTEARKYIDSLVKNARTAGLKTAPAARDAIKTASKHAPELAIETMKASGRAAAGVAGEFAMGVSGVLSGMGSALRGAAKPTKKKAASKKKSSKSKR